MKKDLVLKFTGDVSVNTFPEYKEEALAFVKKADFPIVTNEDFSNSVKDVKECKEIEEAIESAKNNAFAEMEQINKIFDDLGVVSSTVRTFRLKREKDIAKETERKKKKMISDGFSIVSKFFKSSSEKHPLILNVISIDDKPMQLAIKGRRTEASGLKAIADAVEVELSKIKAAIELTVENDKAITSCGYTDLFPDLSQIIGKPTAEVKLLIEGRVAKHQLAEKERKEKEDTEAKAKEEKKKASELASQQQKEKAPPELKPASTPRTGGAGMSFGLSSTPTTKATSRKNPVESEGGEEQDGDFILTVLLTCKTKEAKYFAAEVENMTEGNESVTRIKIDRVEEA
jgi:hypothetical protein